MEQSKKTMSRLHVNCGYSPAPHHLHTQEILKEMKKSDEYKYRVLINIDMCALINVL